MKTTELKHPVSNEDIKTYLQEIDYDYDIQDMAFEDGAKWMRKKLTTPQPQSDAVEFAEWINTYHFTLHQINDMYKLFKQSKVNP